MLFTALGSQADDQHNLRKKWPVRKALISGACHVKADLQVN